MAPFWLGKYEVTQKQWAAVMGDNPYFKTESCGNRGSDSPYGNGDCPVDRVSYENVLEYIAKLNTKTGRHYRLPTEAEWEYACRAGDYLQKYCGSDILDRVAWYKKGWAFPVGQKHPNAFGLYDMSGNVAEWTCSAYQRYGYDGSENKCAANDNPSRVFRGGSFISYPNYPEQLRSLARQWQGDLPTELELESAHHTSSRRLTSEWRFQGFEGLGFRLAEDR